LCAAVAIRALEIEGGDVMLAEVDVKVVPPFIGLVV